MVENKISKGFKTTVEIIVNGRRLSQNGLCMTEYDERLWIAKSIYDKRVDLVKDLLNDDTLNWRMFQDKLLKVLNGEMDDEN
jgi:hypothetical protein